MKITELVGKIYDGKILHLAINQCNIKCYMSVAHSINQVTIIDFGIAPKLSEENPLPRHSEFIIEIPIAHEISSIFYIDYIDSNRLYSLYSLIGLKQSIKPLHQNYLWLKQKTS